MRRAACLLLGPNAEQSHEPAACRKVGRREHESSLPRCHRLPHRFALLAAAPTNESSKTKLDEQKAALAKIQALVGQWRGTGQPQRGSTKGSWIEQADWAWKFTDHSASLIAQLTDGKPFNSLELLTGEQAGEYKLVGTLPGDSGAVTYQGTLDDEGKLTLALAGTSCRSA